MMFEEIRLDRLFREVKDLVPLDGIELLTPSVVHGVVPQKSLENRPQQALRPGYLVSPAVPGDFVISMSSHAHGLEWCGISGGISPDYTLLRPTCDRRLIPFLKYALKCGPIVQQLSLFKTGVRMGLRLQWNKVRYCTLPLPSIDYANAVVPVLNRETARIDALIDGKTRFIELLREKRQALITQAVTRGLDSRAPMKDSGVEWLGLVPSHWRVMSLKHVVATPITDGPHETPDAFAEGVPFVSAEAVSTGKIDFSRIWGFISEEDDARFSKKYRPQRGDIFMVKSGATTGVTAIVDTDERFNIWSPLAVIRCGEKVLPDFMLNFMRSRNFQEAIALNWSFGTQQNIGMGVIGNLRVAVPPVDEQIAAVQQLNVWLSRIASLEVATAKSVELLRERRVALITAAVTGQIDVRADAHEDAMEAA